MKKKIVIKSFSALSFALVVQRDETKDLGFPDLTHRRLRFKPESLQGLSAQAKSLAVAESVLARPVFERALNALRGEGTDNPRLKGLSHGC